LAELVEAIGELGMTSKLNTNGSRLDSHLVSRLSKAGLSEATVSIYSHDPLVHDSVRNEDGLFSRAVRAIDLLKEQSAITVGMQTVLARHNLLDLDKLLGLAYQMNVAYLQVSYVEGGSQAWLPSANQIDLFHSEVAPRMVERIRQKGRRQSLRAIAVVSHLLSGERNAEFSAGNYFPDRRPRCRRPFSFALLLANGDVLPCSGAEYCQGPVMGNLSTEALGLMWCSEAWKAFRKARHGWCHRCPVTLHSRIPLV
jgi:radical SAM protein with 4Fe4S-binding SPASM domain